MESFLEIINKKFDNKYSYLKLLSIVYDINQKLCTITFLYPYKIEEIPQEDKEQLEKFLTDYLSLKNQLKVKYKRSFLDEKLIIEDIVNFFKENKKSLAPYISIENISSTHNDLDVTIEIKLNQDVLGLIDELELKNQIKNYLDKLYIANFEIKIIENDEVLPEEIVADDIIPTLTKARRYNVEVVKKVIGGDIIPKPEYIKDNRKPKVSVILAGFLSGKNQKKFVIKKGKHEGEEKSLYTFVLKDEDGSVDCVYFCPKTHEKDMDALEENMFILCVGDLKYGLSGRITYYIRKLSLASPVAKEQEAAVDYQSILANHKQVVFPDMLPRSNQSFLFDEKANYNDFILKNDIVVFDIETTGLDPETCEITEIGAVKIEHGEVTERFSSFSKPKSPIPIEVQELTNITNEMVANAPRIEDVVIDFYNWSRDCIISGYNIVGFDLKFIKKVANRLGLSFNNTVIDAYIVAKQANIHPSNYKLGTVVKLLGLTLTGAHRAFNDAYATAQVLMELNRKKKPEEKD